MMRFQRDIVASKRRLRVTGNEAAVSKRRQLEFAKLTSGWTLKRRPLVAADETVSGKEADVENQVAVSHRESYTGQSTNQQPDISANHERRVTSESSSDPTNPMWPTSSSSSRMLTSRRHDPSVNQQPLDVLPSSRVQSTKFRVAFIDQSTGSAAVNKPDVVTSPMTSHRFPHRQEATSLAGFIGSGNQTDMTSHEQPEIVRLSSCVKCLEEKEEEDRKQQRTLHVIVEEPSSLTSVKSCASSARGHVTTAGNGSARRVGPPVPARTSSSLTAAVDGSGSDGRTLTKAYPTKTSGVDNRPKKPPRTMLARSLNSNQ